MGTVREDIMQFEDIMDQMSYQDQRVAFVLLRALWGKDAGSVALRGILAALGEATDRQLTGILGMLHETGVEA